MKKQLQVPSRSLYTNDVKKLYPGYLSLQAAINVISTLEGPNDWRAQEIDGMAYIIPFGTHAIKI